MCLIIPGPLDTSPPMFTLPGQAASTTQTPPPPLHAQMAANTRQIATLQVRLGNLQAGHVFVHPDGSKKTKKRIVADLTGVPEDSIIFNRNDGAHSTLNVDIIWCTRQNQVIDNSVNGPPLGGGAGSYNDAWQLDPNGGPPRFHGANGVCEVGPKAEAVQVGARAPARLCELHLDL